MVVDSRILWEIHQILNIASKHPGTLTETTLESVFHEERVFSVLERYEPCLTTKTNKRKWKFGKNKRKLNNLCFQETRLLSQLFHSPFHENTLTLFVLDQKFCEAAQKRLKASGLQQLQTITVGGSDTAADTSAKKRKRRFFKLSVGISHSSVSWRACGFPPHRYSPVRYCWSLAFGRFVVTSLSLWPRAKNWDVFSFKEYIFKKQWSVSSNTVNTRAPSFRWWPCLYFSLQVFGAKELFQRSKTWKNVFSVKNSL